MKADKLRDLLMRAADNTPDLDLRAELLDAAKRQKIVIRVIGPHNNTDYVEIQNWSAHLSTASGSAISFNYIAEDAVLVRVELERVTTSHEALAVLRARCHPNRKFEVV